MKSLILASIIFVSACAVKTIPVQTELPPCPPRPELVKMTELEFTVFGEFAQMNPEIIGVINKRERQIWAHVDTLCGIIETTHVK